MEKTDNSKLVKSYFQAYETNDRGLLEGLLSQSFTFNTSRDDHINRENYFQNCWPSSNNIKSYQIHNLFSDGDEVVIRYDCELHSGATFQNMEHFQFVDGMIEQINVYFGFDLSNDSFEIERAKRFERAFATGDADFVIGNVADDVSWNLVGEKEVKGKEAVANMFEPMRGVVSQEYQTKNILTNGNKAIIEGIMNMPKENGAVQSYAFCDVYTFENANSYTIKELSAYLIELPSEG